MFWLYYCCKIQLMKKYILVSLFALVLAAPALAQKSEFGGMAGVSFYNGEINRKKLFYQPKFAFGAFYRHNFNSHFFNKNMFPIRNRSGSRLAFRKCRANSA
jgi:hypothetical protein